MKAVILSTWDDEQKAAFQRIILSRHPQLNLVMTGSAEEAKPKMTDADIFIGFGHRIRHGFFDNAKQIKWVHSPGTGVDGLIDDPSLHKDIIITATRGIHGPPMSELTLMLMLAMIRGFPQTVRAQDESLWERRRMKLLRGKTVGILGVGLISAYLAPLCKAFGMDVVGISRTARPLPGFDRFHPREDLVKVAKEFDFLVVLIPYSQESHNIVNAELLGAMKPSAFLINVARAGVVDDDALIDALNNGKIAGAGLDVYRQEPLPPEHPFWKMKNLIVNPHNGGNYETYAQDAAEQFCENMDQFLAGHPEKMQHREQWAPVVGGKSSHD